jgi:hypothetical protein
LSTKREIHLRKEKEVIVEFLAPDANICCQLNTIICKACHEGIDEEEYCTKFKYSELCSKVSSGMASPKVKETKKEKREVFLEKPVVKKKLIAICSPTHSKTNWRSLKDTTLKTLLIPSITRTISAADRSQYEFRLYLAADHDDDFWLRHRDKLKTPEWLSVHFGFYKVPKHKIPFNLMMRDAYNDGAEYMVRINDDSEFQTNNWVSKATTKLASYDPPNVGMVGPNFFEGHTGIMTHDMVHRTHLDIFEHYYPDIFSAWWIDDWITKVYGPQRSTKIMDWVVKHHIHKYGTRYTVQHHEYEHLKGELEKGAARVEEWLENAGGIVKALDAKPNIKECRPGVKTWLKTNNKTPSQKCVFTLTNMKNLLQEKNIDFGIAFGTLLGWYRQCSCIDNSEDVDLIITYDDIKDRKHILKKLGTVMYLDRQKQFPRIVKIWGGGMRQHVDLKITYFSKAYNMTWLVDGDERSILRIWDIGDYDLAELHGVRVRVPKDPEKDLRDHYCDRWENPVGWEKLSKTTNRLKLFGSCHFIDVLRKTTQNYDAPNREKFQSDLLEYYLKVGGQCYTKMGTSDRVKCINSQYIGPRGGASSAFDVIKVNDDTMSSDVVPVHEYSLCIGILAYQGVKTLKNTLDSYRKYGLFQMVKESYIFFQKIDSPERREWAEDIARKYSDLIPIYSEKNVHHKSFQELTDACSQSKYVMLLEEDFKVEGTIESTRIQVENALYMLNNGVEAVRMRSRLYGGSPNHSLDHLKKFGKIAKTHTISHIMTRDNAEETIPEISLCRKEPKTWCTSSKFGHYTNNPVMYRTTFLKNMLRSVPEDTHAFNKFEPWLTKWWLKQNFVLAWSEGIFKHVRLDRTFGKLPVPEAPNSKTVVIAAAINYGFTEFKNFIMPLRRVYRDDVVLFINPDVPISVTTLCKQYNITTHPLPSGSRLGVKGNRYMGYYEVCKQYDWCFATDFRDTFFQDNPFPPALNADLIFFEEDKHVKMGYREGRPTCTPTVSIACTCPYNSNWIKTCWGDVFLSKIADESPICSGTIMGTPSGFAELKDKMLSEMERTSTIKGCSARDQGHLNYLYHSQKIKVRIEVQPRGEGIVNTVGYITPRGTIGEHLNSEGLVVNKDHTVSAVVHQYDRFSELKYLLNKLSKLPQQLKERKNKLFITNKKYIAMCDVSYKTRAKNDFKLPLKANSIVCVKGDTQTLTTFFKLDIRQPFTLVTIEMDDAIPQNKKWLNHKYLKKWYSWNSNHPDVIPIPIGLNEDSQLESMSQATPVIPKIEKVLVNFKQDRQVRQMLFKKVEDLPYIHVQPYSKKWHSKRELKAHYESISKYKWTLCPRGAGQDTHRLWEALYLGSIPIVLKSSISSLYEGLPVIQLNNWNELSLEILKERSELLVDKRHNAYFTHWEKIIKREATKRVVDNPHFYLDAVGERAEPSCTAPCPYTYQSVMIDGMRTVRMDDYPYPSTTSIEKQQDKLKLVLDIFEKYNVPYILGVSPLQLLLKGEISQHIEFLNSVVKKGYVCMHGFDHRTTKGTDTADVNKWKYGGEFAQYGPSELENLWKQGHDILLNVNRYTIQHFIPPFNAITQNMVNVLMNHGVKFIHSFDVALKHRGVDAGDYPYDNGGNWGGWIEDYKVDKDVIFVVAKWRKTYTDIHKIKPEKESSQIVLHWYYDTQKKDVVQNYEKLALAIQSVKNKKSKKIISFSLYGSNPRYTDGALENAKLCKKIYPEWTMRVYYDNSVPKQIVAKLKASNVQLIDMSDSKMNKMSWRFQAASDSERFCSRDIDSRLSKREAAAVEEWIRSGKEFHVMRDHPSHSLYQMSGGMWCSKTIPNMSELLTNIKNQAYLQDMNFLNKVIWPIAQKSILQHDSFSCDKFGGGKPFPTARVGWEHVGSVYINGKMRQGDVDILKKKQGIEKCKMTTLKSIFSHTKKNFVLQRANPLFYTNTPLHGLLKRITRIEEKFAIKEYLDAKSSKNSNCGTFCCGTHCRVATGGLYLCPPIYTLLNQVASALPRQSVACVVGTGSSRLEALFLSLSNALHVETYDLFNSVYKHMIYEEINKEYNDERWVMHGGRFENMVPNKTCDLIVFDTNLNGPINDQHWRVVDRYLKHKNTVMIIQHNTWSGYKSYCTTKKCTFKHLGSLQSGSGGCFPDKSIMPSNMHPHVLSTGDSWNEGYQYGIWG